MKITFPRLRKSNASAEPSISAFILEVILTNGAEQKASQIFIRVNHYDPPVSEDWLKWSSEGQISKPDTPLHHKSISIWYLVDGEMLEQIRLAFNAYQGLSSYVLAQREMQLLQVHEGARELVITP